MRLPRTPLAVAFTLLPLLSACHDKEATPAPAASASTTSNSLAPAAKHDGISRSDFNRFAVRLDLPLYWVSDKNHDGSVDPDEVASLLFYPTEGHWVDGGHFTEAFEKAFADMKGGAAGTPKDPDDAKRVELVVSDLDQGTPTLVSTDLRGATGDEKAFVRHMLSAAHQIDDLYATMNGSKALAARVPADPASQSLFRRNWGPKCKGPKTEKDPACTAIPGAPKPVCDAYPTDLQADPRFCDKLEKLPNAKALLDHFVVVRDDGHGKLGAVSYADAYKDPMRAIAEELRSAAAALTDPSEASLKDYLTADAASFTSNDWEAADEAWAKMTPQSSKWYVRAAPDEVYWDPCNHKAGFHVTFARINKDSLRWQEKLSPLEGDMEQTLAGIIGAPYAARKVMFHLPDFIDIVFNAGNDREPMGGTIGESLPNWGKLVAEGRGRTVAMSNLYTDADSLAIRRNQAESLLTADAAKAYVDSAEPGLLATILHEATHNLGPAHEYTVKGKTDEQAFGGGLASMLEELKAQSGALYYIEYLRKKGVISDEVARQTYANEVVWAFGHISRGMYTESGESKPYSHLSAIQLGFLMDDGALTFDTNAPAANGKDHGAFVVDYAKLPASIEKLMKLVGTIKATNDRARAEELTKKYVDSDRVPQKIIAERELRYPKATFVYAIEM